jgi:hypothetical protein
LENGRSRLTDDSLRKGTSMEHTMRAGLATTVAKVAVALLAGLVVLVLLYPVAIAETLPPQCFSVFGYGVPCDAGWSLAAGAATAGILGLLLWLKDRRR